jgi:hypothetical protein
MVAPVSASGANVISLFGGRPVPAARQPAHAEAPFEADKDGSAGPSRGRAGGSPPRPMLSFDAAATLQEGREPTPEEQARVRELTARDAEVRAHERAHAAAGGQYAGSPSYEYQRGPDGRDYAIGGEVPIDTSPVAGDPKATIEKMEQVKAAATAPAEPSPQDRQVAAKAEAERQKAARELQAQKAEPAKAADGGFEAFTASDFRRVGRSETAAPAPAPEPVAQRPTRPGRPSVVDIVV